MTLIRRQEVDSSLSLFRRRACPGLDLGPESRFSLALQRAKMAAGLRRHDKPILHL